MWFAARTMLVLLVSNLGAAMLACAPAPSSTTPDAGNIPPGDVAAPGPDAAVPGVDAAVPGPDAAMPSPDAAVSVPDAATPGMDASSPGADASTSDDAGTTGATDSGVTTTPDAGDAALSCQDDDPLTQSDWVGFCGDRVDDNCQIDAPSTPCPDGPSSHNYCRTADEPCPATQPASAAPTWDCSGTPPANVLAYASYDNSSNLNVTSFCAFVYESSAVAGEHYVAVAVTNGSNVRAAQPGTPNRDCQADTFARRHFYLSDLDDGDCPDVKYIHAYPNPSTGYQGYPVDDQKLSNRCRKMIRNIGYNDPAFNPDIQYFAASREEALAKLAILDTAEVNCIGIDNLQNQPYRTTEQFYVQASAPLTLVQP